MIRNLFSYLPGMAIAFAVAILATLFARYTPFLNLLGAPAIAIFLGIILGNLFLSQPILAKGTRFSESRLLEYSVMLLGTSVTFQTIMHLGVNGLLFIVIQMAFTILAAIYIGKKLKFSQSTYLLMASGNAVCGSSAIAATAPVVGASNDERGLVITIVNLMGTVMMFTMPLVAWLLFKSDTLLSSALIGGTLQSVGQVVASASIVSDAVNDQAIIYKIVRIIFIVAIVIIFGRISQHNPSADPSIKQSNNNLNEQSSAISPKKNLPQKSKKRRNIIPWYVYAFLIMCTLSSFSLFPEWSVTATTFIRNWFELIALAAIGLRLNFSLLKSQGRAFMVYGLSLGTIQTVTAVILVYLFIR